MVTIRPARLDDLKAITEIYNEAILTTDATFDTEPKSDDEQKVWFANHGPRSPLLVAELDGTVIGWASLSEWSPRRGYANTAEVSFYVKQEFRGRGTGRMLLDAIVREGQKVGLHTVIARITTGNKESIHLHEQVGFEHVGIMREVGQKFGRLLDICLMQKIYSPEISALPENKT
jgi:L-amino acid N-acyltransferase YncA